MIENTRLLRFREHRESGDSRGALAAIEAHKDIPFPIRRVYYIYDVGQREVRRGFHAHRNLEQVMVCVHGSVRIVVKTPRSQQEIRLSDPCSALYVGPMVWREMYDFSPGAVLMVLASEHYDEKDYIREYSAYEREAKDYFMSNVERETSL